MRIALLLLSTLTAFACSSDREAYSVLELAYEAEQVEISETALELFEQAAELLPDVYVRTELAAALLRRREYESAIVLLEGILQESPAYVAANRHLAAAYAGREDTPAALEILERVAKVASGHSGVERDLVHLYMVEDQFDMAIDRLKAVTDRRPDERWAHYQLGHLYFQLQAFAQAEASYRVLLDLDPDSPAAYAALGNTYYELKQIESAVEAYERAIDLNPRDHRSMNNLAWAFAVEDLRIEDGIRLSRKSLRMLPGSPTYLDTLAELYFKQGDPAKALSLIRRALANAQDEDETLTTHLKRQQAKFQAAGQGHV